MEIWIINGNFVVFNIHVHCIIYIILKYIKRYVSIILSFYVYYVQSFNQIYRNQRLT